MAMRLAGCAMLVLTVLVAAASLRAGADVPAGTPIAVVVTDTRGQTVHNLSPTDFEITENGEARTVASVSRRRAPRVIGLMLDDFHVAAGEPTERVRHGLSAFIDKYLTPEDTVFVLRPLDPQNSIHAAPSLDIVRERIAGFNGRKDDYTPRNAFERDYLSTSPVTAARQRAQVVRSGLEALAVAMRESRDAAKALIVVTEGFQAEQRDRYRSMTLRSTARAAALSNIPVYVLDPSGSAAADGPFNETWKALVDHTGGALVRGVSDLVPTLARIGTDLGSQFVLRFNASGKQDGGFHDLQLKSRRAGVVLRAPSGYWTPFPASAFAPLTPRIDHSKLLTPHITGLVQPWFRMAPGEDGRTRVTFFWSARPNRTAASVEFAAVTFEGATVHAAVVPPASAEASGSEQTTFEAAPGALQISLAIHDAGSKWLGREVRYIDVPRFDPARPVIAAVEFIRPRSLPEFTALQSRADAVPTAVREFVRQDRLLVRVRAFAGSAPATVEVTLMNRAGEALLTLRPLSAVGGAAQFELPFARYARGEYRLQIRATGAGQTTSQILPVQLIG